MNKNKVTISCTDSIVPAATKDRIDIKLGCGYVGNIDLNQISANTVFYKGERFTVFCGVCPSCGRMVEVSSFEIPEENQEQLKKLVKVSKN